MDPNLISRHIRFQLLQPVEHPYTPFITLFADANRARNWAQRLKAVGAQDVQIVTISTERLAPYHQYLEEVELDDDYGGVVEIPPAVVWMDPDRVEGLQEPPALSGGNGWQDRYVSIRQATERLLADVRADAEYLGDWLAVNYIHRWDVHEISDFL